MRQQRDRVERLLEPPGWQDDLLSRFFATSNYNTFSLFDRYKAEWQLFAGIDDTFDKLVGNLDTTPYETSVFLLQRSHSAYLAALRLLVATQYVDAYPLLRSVIEYGVYALYFRDHPEAFETWSQRHYGDEERRAARRLKFSVMLNHLENKDERLGKAAQKFYDMTIDLGAHPNPGAIVSAYKQDTQGDEVYNEVNYLAGEGLGFQLAVKQVTLVGILALEIASCVFPERANILSIPQAVEVLNRRYNSQRSPNNY